MPRTPSHTSHTITLPIKLNQTTLRNLDRARGTTPRSTYIRHLITRALNTNTSPTHPTQ
jgi:hypothetical protein